jgi:hypothetical protein
LSTDAHISFVVRPTCNFMPTAFGAPGDLSSGDFRALLAP